MSYLNPTATEARRARLIVGAGAVLATIVIAALFYIQAITKVPKPPPTIIYVESWQANRTRQDALDERARDQATLDGKLAASRRYIASLPADKRKPAQAEYDRYVAAKPHERIN